MPLMGHSTFSSLYRYRHTCAISPAKTVCKLTTHRLHSACGKLLNPKVLFFFSVRDFRFQNSVFPASRGAGASRAIQGFSNILAMIGWTHAAATPARGWNSLFLLNAHLAYFTPVHFLPGPHQHVSLQPCCTCNNFKSGKNPF